MSFWHWLYNGIFDKRVGFIFEMMLGLSGMFLGGACCLMFFVMSLYVQSGFFALVGVLGFLLFMKGIYDVKEDIEG